MRWLFAILPVLLAATTGWAESSLQFADLRESPPLIGDSIPLRAGERLVLFKSRVAAEWVVVLINLPYEQAREKLREVIEKAFGIETEGELSARVLPERQSPYLAEEPLLGDGGIEFRRVGVQVPEGREFRIGTKRYNESGLNNHSTSGWRIIDGNRLFGKPCSVFVVSRIDHSREWAKMHPGIPLPFKLMGEFRLVTDTETKQVETLLKVSGNPTAQYFVHPDGYYSKDTLFQLARAIRDAAGRL